MDRIAKLLKLLEADPADAFCLYSLGQEHSKTGNTEQAVAYFDRALAADSGYLYAYYHKARVLQAAGQAESALATLSEGIAHASQLGDAKAEREMRELHAAVQVDTPRSR